MTRIDRRRQVETSPGVDMQLEAQLAFVERRASSAALESLGLVVADVPFGAMQGPIHPGNECACRR